MENIHMKLFLIWTSDSGDVVLRFSLYLALGPSCSMEQNHLCNFIRWHYRAYCKFEPVVQEEMLFNPYKSSVLFVGQRQTVMTQIRHRMWRPIRVSTVCLQNVHLKF